VRRVKALFASVIAVFKGLYGRIHAAFSRRWQALRAARPSVRHLGDAWQRLQENHGGQYAAAISYYSFLALFPLLLLTVSVIGFVLHSNKDAQDRLLQHIVNNFPAGAADALVNSVKTFVNNRASVGIIALFGLLLTGLGWINNIRTGVEVMWGRPHVRRNMFQAKFSSLLILAGLGLSALVSVFLTVIGTRLSSQIVQKLNLDHYSWAPPLVRFGAPLIALLADIVIFLWLFIWLPGVRVHPVIALKGAVLASAGFEVLKIVGTYTVAHTSQSLTAGPFASVIALLVWIQLMSRMMLFCAAWTSILAQSASASDLGSGA
jgi:membrane protein